MHTRLDREAAIQKALAYTRQKLASKTHDELLEMLVTKEDARLRCIGSVAELSNAVIAITNGEIGVIRTDLGDAE